MCFHHKRTQQFSYKVRAASTVDAYTFAGSLTYLDSSDNPQTGIAVKGDDRVAVSPAGVSVERGHQPGQGASWGPGGGDDYQQWVYGGTDYGDAARWV